jgi:hypothetical protein
MSPEEAGIDMSPEVLRLRGLISTIRQRAHDIGKLRERNKEAECDLTEEDLWWEAEHQAEMICRMVDNYYRELVG